MRRFAVAGVLAMLALILAATGAVASGNGASVNGGGTKDGLRAGKTDRPSPQGLKQRELAKEAVKLKLQGKLAKDAKVAQFGSDKQAKGDKKGKHSVQFVELERKGEDTIWSVLMEFGNAQATHNHGAFGVINHGGTAGPLHNAIPQPDRKVDNTTIWAPNFDKSYYENLLFSEKPGVSSMRNFYIENSSGAYAVNGTVEDWVQLPNNEAAYGSNYCGDIVCSRDIQRLLEDGLNGWYAKQIAAGKTDAQINDYLSQFDKWDRYDYDGDGVFNEPDGYIDHFQAIHAGVGEETGGGAQGTDAIWSHRSATNVAGIGSVGPDGNKFGGLQIGGSKYWVFDYTVEPENGGVGVFSHEFGHDLGIPDEYDTSGNTGGAENSTGFWTPWSSGSYGSDGTPANGIGNRPFSMSAWDKLVFGWLDYQFVKPGDGKTKITLGPSEAQSTAGKQAAVVTLPDKQVAKNVGTPFAGSKFYYSGTGNDMDNAMFKSVALPAGAASLTAKARYNIEGGWDYAYVIVSTDGGAHWTTVHTNLSTNESPNGQNFGEGITGVSTGETWVDLTADLSAYAGKTVLLGFEYWTDPAQEGDPSSDATPGISLDNIAISGQPLDGAETTAAGRSRRDRWLPRHDGRRRASRSSTPTSSRTVSTSARTSSVSGSTARSASRRTTSAARSAPTGPSGIPYEDGVLIWYWNTEYANNNVGDHPGEGEILPVDAHPGCSTGPTAASCGHGSSPTTRRSASRRPTRSRCT